MKGPKMNYQSYDNYLEAGAAAEWEEPHWECRCTSQWVCDFCEEEAAEAEAAREAEEAAEAAYMADLAAEVAAENALAEATGAA